MGVTGFAMQITWANGGEYHAFGRGEQQRAEFEQMVAGWRTQPPNAYYSLVDPDGNVFRAYVRDIADVRMVNR